MNSFKIPKAEFFWMSSEERLQFRMSLSARRWALLVGLAGILGMAVGHRPDRVLLTIHGAALILSLAVGSSFASRKSSSWMVAPWPSWATRILIGAAGILAMGVFGIGGSAKILVWLGHPAPFGPLEGMQLWTLALLVATGYAIALAGLGAWATTWRWRLGTGGRSLEAGGR